ncbi:MAG: response regulator receiver modulated metal dependent phosphohydrolase [Solirubrobacterales bacterium]|nr:response regulator receiver modulated metal dependent phosphohydrolase [Solirubrobacterales bacterium]
MPDLARLRAEASIVVVDDDPVSLRVLRRSLQRAGFVQVVTCQEPAAVADALDENDADVLVLDLAMPGMDGFSLLEELRPRVAADPPLRVVMVSGHDHPSIVARARELGVRQFLTKTASHAEFVAAIDAASAG